MSDYHKLTVEDSLKHLATSYPGLAEEEVVRRLTQTGKNTLLLEEDRNFVEIIQRIVSDTPGLLLLPSALILIVLARDLLTFILLLLIVLVNTYITLIALGQNARTKRLALDLGGIQNPKAIVRRAGNVQEIDAEDLVPGDIVLLEQGDRIPADGRVIASAGLQVAEAYLTGRQDAVEKDATVIHTDEALELDEMANMVFMGTTVYQGRGEIVITATGQQTELGKVDSLLRSEFASPLKAGNPRTSRLNLQISILALIVSGGVLLLFVARQSPWEAILLGMATTILAVVPEALPAVMRRVTSIGSQRIRKLGVDLKYPEASETLGAITALCIGEKTIRSGLNYAVTVLDVAGKTLEFDPALSEKGDLVSKSAEAFGEIASNQQLSDLVLAMALTSYPAEIAWTDRGEALVYGGNPLERALLVAATRLGLKRDDLAREYPLVSTYPSRENPEAVLSVHELPTTKPGLDFPESFYLIYARGAARQMASLSSRLVLADGTVPMTDEWRKSIDTAIDRIERGGMDAYAFSFCLVHQLPYMDIWQKMHEMEPCLIGLVGVSALLDPNLKKNVAKFHEAGIRILLLSSKNPRTVLGLGGILGLQDGRLLVDDDLDQMSMAEIAEIVNSCSIFASLGTTHKRWIVQALQDYGHTVAVTGEGASDLPIMLQADMGISFAGSEASLAEHVADLSISQPARSLRPSQDFAEEEWRRSLGPILYFIEHGRAVHDNVRKVVRYFLSCSFGEVVVLFGGFLAGLPRTLIPLQILWLNTAVIGLLALSLASEQPEITAMRRMPYAAVPQILSRSLVALIIYPGLLMGLLSAGLGYGYWLSDPGGVWGTMVFASLGFSQILLSLVLRVQDEPLFRIGIFSNRAMFRAIFLTFALLLAIIYVPALQILFKTKLLGFTDLVICLLPGFALFILVELEKRFKGW